MDPDESNPGHSSRTGAWGIDEAPGTVIGPYKLLQVIGEGGFGVVYLAEQERPVRRNVALKIIKPGMDSAQVIARFESERQALALMDHPNIARVHDAGATRSGRPYFVMELVKGVPITDFCDKSHAGAEQRLDLFLDVCQAIQHAHHKGVIHRDIKPSNVMVTLHGSTPVVKVIDFGVAKAVSQKLTERTLFTAVDQIIGTPAYMSPEQAERSGLDVDARSDVYSLGVLLYELLTGTPPLDVQRLDSLGIGEMQRLIREEDPPRPSTRLSTLGAGANRIAKDRGTEPRRLRRLLEGDLDCVVMKALEKDRNRRYATPASLAEDIERYLRHEAILARPPSAAYRMKRFVRRNRAAVVTVVGIAMALLVGATVATWQAVRAMRAEARAVAERDRAEESFREARAAVDEYFTAVSESTLLDAPGMQPLRRDLLERASSYYQGFLAQREGDAGVEAALAATYYRVAWITSIIGSAAEAEGHYRRALSLYDGLSRAQPDVERYRTDRAIVLNDLGVLLGNLGRTAESLDAHTEALAIRAPLARAHPDEGRYHNEVAKSHGNIARLLLEGGRAEEALKHLEAARAIDERWSRAPTASLATFPTDLGRNFNSSRRIRLDLAGTTDQIAYALYRLGRTEDAIQARLRARGILEELVAEDPDDIDARGMLVGVLAQIAFVHDVHGRPDEARDSLLEALAIIRPLAAENPAVGTLQSRLAAVLRQSARSLRRDHRTDEARAHLDEAKEIQEALVRTDPDNERFTRELAYVFRDLGRTEREAGRPAVALEWYRRAIEIDAADAQRSVGACYDLACNWALGIELVGWRKPASELTPAEAAERRRMADEAMAALHRAVDGGWRNLEHIARDEDLDSLRERADFRELAAELTARNGAGE